MRKRSGLVIGMFWLIVQACLFVPPTTLAVTATPSATVTSTKVPPSPTVTITPTSTVPCERDTASVTLSASATNLKVGDTVKITVRVNNEGCLALGLPQYRLYTADLGRQDFLFSPPNPEPIVHYLAVSPGQSDEAEFELQAVASGEAPLGASVSYEVHIGYPGPAYWGMATSAEPLIITVAP